MANQWFRMYADAVDNGKLKLLAFEDRWHYVAIMCCRSQGLTVDTPNFERILSVKLGVQLRELDEIKRRLMEVHLLLEDWSPKGWDERQYNSDSSAERTRKYRENKKLEATVTHVTSQKRHGDVTVTPPETETDTEKEKELTNVSSKKKAGTLQLLESYGITGQLADDFIKFRNANKWTITETALAGFKREADKADISTAEAVTIAIERSWRGFKAEWLQNQNGRLNNENDPILIAKRRKAQRDNEMYEWAWGTGDADPRKNDLEGAVIDLRAKVC